MTLDDAQISIQVDNRIRLISYILALTDWPAKEQARYPHGVHQHIRSVHAHLAEATENDAVKTMQELMDSGHSLDMIFSYVACLNYPGLRAKGSLVPDWAPKEWSAQIRNFMHAFKVRNLWELDSAAWDSAIEEAERALAVGDPVGFLTRFFGPLDVRLVFQPNLSYPTIDPVGFRWGKKLFCVCPPTIAWGNNPPWPYDNDPAITYRQAILTYSRVLLQEYLTAHPKEAEMAQRTPLPLPSEFRDRYPDWFEQFAVVVTAGLTAIFLEETFGRAEFDAYVMMTQKAHGFSVLPTVVDVLYHYLEEYEQGNYTEFADYMPSFCKTLRVAERIRRM